LLGKIDGVPRRERPTPVEDHRVDSHQVMVDTDSSALVRGHDDAT
jgi:hypothetical protein